MEICYGIRVLFILIFHKKQVFYNEKNFKQINNFVLVSDTD